MSNSYSSTDKQLYAGAGLALVGAGVSIAMDAGLRRAGGASSASWIMQGTVGLALLGAGLSVFGEGVALRALELAKGSDPAVER